MSTGTVKLMTHAMQCVFAEISLQFHLALEADTLDVNSWQKLQVQMKTLCICGETVHIIDQHSWPVGQLTKVVWLTAFLEKKKTFFVQHFWLASQCPTSKFDKHLGPFI